MTARMIWQTCIAMHRNIIPLLLATTATAFFPMVYAPAAYAANPTIRANDREGSTRLVMEWESPPQFSQRIIDDKVSEIIFQESISPDLSQLKKLNGLSDIRIVSDPGKPTRLWLSLTKPGAVRAFSVGNRLIIDIPQDPDFKAENKKDSEPTKNEEQKISAEEVKKTEAVKQVDPVPVIPVISEKIIPVLEKKPEPSILQFSVTEQIPLAGYGRDDRFLLVLDQPDFALPPALVNSDGAPLKPERVPLLQASGFSYPVSSSLNARAQGGGLNWKIIFSSSADSSQKTVRPERIMAPDGKAAIAFKIPSAKRVIDTVDTKRGQKIFIVPVTTSDEAGVVFQSFPEFDVLPSAAGLAIASKVDDLNVEVKNGVVTVARPSGLAISTQQESQKYDTALRKTIISTPAAQPLTEPPPSITTEKPAITSDETRIFRFDRWEMGGPDALKTNAQILLNGAAKRNDDDRVQDYLTLAKLNLSNGKGNEAIGFLDLALEKLPVLSGNPEFLAIRGASHAISGQYDDAFKDFSNPKLDGFSEINSWRAFVLSNLQDWKQAAEKLPANFDLPSQYPKHLRDPVILAMAEISLRAGDLGRAEKALTILRKNEKELLAPDKEHLKYLEGEFFRQKGEKEKAKELWAELTKSKDNYFRARGGMALASLLIAEDEIKPEDAIDKLEGLRFSWRGDELEASISQKLGEMYLDKGETLKGLGVLRTAASLMPGSENTGRITTIMSDAFKKLFLGEVIKKISPMDAVTIHEEFPELLPLGEEGDKVTDALIDRLVAVDLVPRAATILQYQIDHRLTGIKAADATLRLASLFLLDQKPKEAITALQKANDLLAGNAEALASRSRDIALLRAKALSQLKEPEQAFEALNDLPQDFDVLSLKADIAWQTGRWTEASAALADIVFQEDITPTRPPTDDQASLILNWAVAMNLAGDRSGLAGVREKYGDLMKQTPYNDTFEVVTRPRQATLLADRDTLNGIIAEVDLFKDFLAAYRAKPVEKAKPAENPVEKSVEKTDEKSADSLTPKADEKPSEQSSGQ